MVNILKAVIKKDLQKKLNTLNCFHEKSLKKKKAAGKIDFPAYQL
jgi:hypothetical protein